MIATARIATTEQTFDSQTLVLITHCISLHLSTGQCMSPEVPLPVGSGSRLICLHFPRAILGLFVDPLAVLHGFSGPTYQELKITAKDRLQLHVKLQHRLIPKLIKACSFGQHNNCYR